MQRGKKWTEAQLCDGLETEM